MVSSAALERREGNEREMSRELGLHRDGCEFFAKCSILGQNFELMMHKGMLLAAMVFGWQ
jgi:hypothetical protein